MQKDPLTTFILNNYVVELTEGKKISLKNINNPAETIFSGEFSSDTWRLTDASGANVSFLSLDKIPFLNEALTTNRPEKVIVIAHSDEKGTTLEIPSLKVNGKKFEIYKSNNAPNGEDSWVLADDPHKELCTRSEFAEQFLAFGKASPYRHLPFDESSPVIIFKRKGDSDLEGGTYTLLFPYSELEREEKLGGEREILNCKTKSELEKIPDLNKLLPYGTIGKTLMSTMKNFAEGDDENLQYDAYSLCWRPSYAGRADAWKFNTTDAIEQTCQAIDMMQKALRRRDYESAITWLNLIPSVTPFSDQSDPTGIKKLQESFYEAIFDENALNITPEIQNFRMKLFTYWLGFDNKIVDFLEQKSKNKPNGALPDILAGALVECIHLMDGRYPTTIDPIYQFSVNDLHRLLNYLDFLNKDQRQSLLKITQISKAGISLDKQGEIVEKLLNSNEKEECDRYRIKPLPKFPIVRPIKEINLSPKEVDLANVISTNLNGLNLDTANTDQPQSTDNKLSVIENSSASGIEKSTQKYYQLELEHGRKKQQQNIALTQPISLNEMNSVKMALENVKKELSDRRLNTKETLTQLIKKMIGKAVVNDSEVDVWVASFLLQVRQAEEKTKKHSIHIKLPDGQSFRFTSQDNGNKTAKKLYEDFIVKCREFMLEKVILDKTSAALKNIDLVENITNDSSLNEDQKKGLSQAAAKNIREDIKSLKNIFISPTPSTESYKFGEDLNSISTGVSIEETLAFVAISGMFPRNAQASLLNKIFKGDISAFQLVMGGGKTSVMLPMMAFFISTQKEANVPCVAAHFSQIESLKGTIAHEYKERFGRDTYTLTIDRNSMKDINFVKHVNFDLKEAKKQRKLLLISANDMAKIELSYIELFEEYCAIFKQQKEYRNNLIKINEEIQKSPGNSSERQNLEILRQITESKISSVEQAIVHFSDVHAPLMQEINTLLNFFRNDVTALIDEADSVLKSTDEVNFPRGERKPLDQTIINGSMKLAKLITQKKENGKSLFRLAENEQDKVTPEEFQADATILAERLLHNDNDALKNWLHSNGITEECFVKYVTKEQGDLGNEAERLMNNFLKKSNIDPKEQSKYTSSHNRDNPRLLTGNVEEGG